MNPLTEHDDPSAARIRSALRGAAASLDLPTPGAAAARATAHHRARRQQRVTAGIASVAVVAGGVAVASVVVREPGVDLETPAVGSTPGGTPAGITFEWTAGEHVLAQQPRIVQAPDGVLYALSTAPGVTYDDAGPEGTLPLPQAVYRSTDGLTWEPTVLAADLQLSSFDVGPDGILYGLSTAPGDSGGTALQVASSGDGGASWQEESLPIVEAPPAVADGVVLTGGGTQSDIVTSGDRSVVIATSQWFVEPAGLLTPEELEAGDTWLAPTQEGLQVQQIPFASEPPAPVPSPTSSDAAGAEATEVMADEVEILRTIPWAEIGLSGPDDLVVTQVIAEDGSGTWTQTSLPTSGLSSTVVATAEGFVALLPPIYSESDVGSGTQVARSADGIAWTLDPEPIAVDWVQDVQAIGDRLVLVGERWTDTSSQVSALSSTDAGRTWTVTDLTALVPVADGQTASVFGADLGPLGAATPGMVFEEESGAVVSSALLYSPDGATWESIDVADLAPGAEQLGWVSIDADRIVASVVMEDGSRRSVVGTPQR